ncbi:fatty acid desaturase 2 [Canna indica]|uniref:Fatty acid desaturase 2 n=1 Tax=Canna indica TaxID=4628 RepID=A0AAQ3Q256_9LILI|nr:fatty acid desaturase 2 [Canna indica]
MAWIEKCCAREVTSHAMYVNCDCFCAQLLPPTRHFYARSTRPSPALYLCVHVHPCYEFPLLDLAGQDITDAFIAYHPSATLSILDSSCVPLIGYFLK